MEETINYKEQYEKLLIEYNELKKKLKTYTAPLGKSVQNCINKLKVLT